MAEKIIPVNMLEDYKSCKSKYALYVNRVRSTPGIRDGLKPVARRALYAATFDEHMYGSASARKKSAALVGKVIAKYHPHGDTSVYDVIKVLTNDFEVNQPLFIGQGNWGNADGDGQAAMRYTETRLNPFVIDCLIGDMIESKSVVDWKPNFDNSCKEPESLAPKVAYLLLNGAFGLGVGLSCNIPGHNLGDIIDAQLRNLRDPNAPVVLKPEHAMPVYIVNTNWKAISNKGLGKYIARAIIENDTRQLQGRGDHYPALIVKSLPDRVYMGSIVEKIKKMIDEKKILFIKDLISESYVDKKTRKDIFQYAIILKKGTDMHFAKEFLYKVTDLQKSYSVNFEVLDDTDPNNINPVRLSYQAYINFVNQQTVTNKFRLYTFKIQELKTTIHKRNAFINLLNSGRIMEVIELIRSQKTVDDQNLIDTLVKLLKVTPLQAKYIINQPTKKLSEGYLKQYIENTSNAEEKINFYEARLFNEDLIKDDIEAELIEIKKKYAKPHKAIYIDESEINGIPEGEFKIMITESNYIKKVGMNESFGNLKGSMIKCVLKADNTKSILLFDEQGKVFNLPVHKIPVGDKTTAPIDIRTILKNATSNINTVIYQPELERISKLKVYHFITVVTEKNIKKMDLADFLSVNTSGLKYINLTGDDKVTAVSIIPDGMDILLYSQNKALRMNIAEVPHMKRINVGARAMNTDEPIEGMSVITPDVTHIVAITESGRVNKMNVSGLALSTRNKAGSRVIKLGAKDSIHSIYGLNESNTISVLTSDDRIDIPVASLREGSSISTGEKLIKLPNASHIIKCELKR